MTEVNVRFRWMGEGVSNALLQAVDEGLQDGARAIAVDARRSMRDKGGESAPGSPPGVGTGTLRRSIVEAKVAPLVWRAGTNVFYGRILEFGGTFYSTGKKFTIPLSDKAKRLRARHSDLRAAKLDFVKTPNGAFLVKNVGGKNARTEFMFILKHRNTIQPRPWLRPAIRRLVASGSLMTTIRRGAARSLSAKIVASARSAAGAT